MAWNIIWNIFAIFFAAPQDYPDHVGVVNDFANEIDSQTKAKIEAVIADAQKKADVRIVVVVVTSLGGKAPADYAVGLGNKWGVGQKGKNNGILFLHAPKERKIWIANGYGVESRLTDIEAKMIIDQTIIPLMKEKKFAEAMLRGTEEIARVVSAPEKQPEKQETGLVAPKADSSGIGMGGVVMIVILVAVALVIFLIVISNTAPAYPTRMVTPRHYSPPSPKQESPLEIDPLMTGMLAATVLGSSAPPAQNNMPPLPPIPPAPEPSIADAFLAEQRRRDEEDRRRRRRREEEEEEERRRRRRRDDDSSSSYGGSSSSSSSYDSGSSSSSFDGGSFGGGGAGGEY